jgi:hypothetical protein
MAVRDSKPVAYSRGRQPSLENPEFRQNFSPFSLYADGEFADLERALKTLNNLIPQVADAEPANPLKGMIRYAVSPWDPLGRGDGPVVYDGSAWQLLTNETFTSLLSGIVPASGGGTVNYLRADGSWNVPPEAVLLDTQTVTTANADFSSISSGYDDLLFEFIGISHNSGSNQSPRIAFSDDNGSTFKNITGMARGSGTVNTSATTPMTLSGTAFAGTGLVYGSLRVRQYKATDKGYFDGYITRSDAAFYDTFAGVIDKSTAINMARFNWSAGNIDAGSIKLYGIKRA